MPAGFVSFQLEAEDKYVIQIDKVCGDSLSVIEMAAQGNNVVERVNTFVTGRSGAQHVQGGLSKQECRFGSCWCAAKTMCGAGTKASVSAHEHIFGMRTVVYHSTVRTDVFLSQYFQLVCKCLVVCTQDCFICFARGSVRVVCF